MPGTIQVSVIGLVDFPKTEAKCCPFSVKIAMGRREYPWRDQSDCLIPVVSLRENLTVVVQNVEGNEIFQKEFRTISVVEKGLLEDSCPLMSGGYINIKLRFLLSQEEHIRIRELRESALKRKHEEQPKKTETKVLVSGQITGNWIARPVTEGVLDQSQQRDPGSSGSLGTASLRLHKQPLDLSFNGDIDQMMKTGTDNLKIESRLDISKCQTSSKVGLTNETELPRSSISGNATERSYSDSAELSSQQLSDFSYTGDVVPFIEASRENLKIQSPADSISENQISSKVTSDHRSERPRSSVARNATEHCYPDSAELKADQRRSNVKKMVTAFENSIFQGPEPHFGLRTKSSMLKLDMESSLKRVPSEDSDLDKLSVIPKSFSTGLLTDVCSQPAPKFFRSAFIKNQWSAERFDTMGKKKASLESKNDQELNSQDAVKPKDVRKTLHTTMAVTSVHFTQHIQERDGFASTVFNRGPAMSLMIDFKAFEDILNPAVVSDSCNIFNPQTVNETTDTMLSSCSREKLEVGSKHNPVDEGISNGISNSDMIHYGNGILRQQSSTQEYASQEETQKTSKIFGSSGRTSQHRNLGSYQQWWSLGGTTKTTESECSRIYSCGEVISASPGETADFLTYFDADECHFVNHDVWNTRRLCITSGTRQLRDLVDCCTNSEKNPSTESGAQNSSHDDASFEVNKNGKSSFTFFKQNHENSRGISKSNGGLIEQGVRIAIVIVACVTLLFITLRDKKSASKLENPMASNLSFSGCVEADAQTEQSTATSRKKSFVKVDEDIE